MAHRHTLDMFEIFYENLEKQLEEFFSMVEKPTERDGEVIPAVDIYECNNFIHIEIELPGVKRDNINLTIQGSRLILEATKPNEDRALERKNHLCIERRFGVLKRQIDIKWPCDTNRIKAVLKNGLLTIMIPKIEDRRGKVRKIEIEEE